jgi:hypothetical protein
MSAPVRQCWLSMEMSGRRRRCATRQESGSKSVITSSMPHASTWRSRRRRLRAAWGTVSRFFPMVRR